MVKYSAMFSINDDDDEVGEDADFERLPDRGRDVKL